MDHESGKWRAAKALLSVLAAIVLFLWIMWMRFSDPENPVSVWAWRGLWLIVLPVILIGSFRLAVKGQTTKDEAKRRGSKPS